MNRRFLALLSGLAIGGGFLWLAIRNVDLGAVGHTMLRADLWMALPFVAALALFYWLKAARWSWILSPIARIEAHRLVPPMMIGFAGNNVLPVRLGELLRIFLCSREHSLPYSAVLATVALERLFDAMALLLILVIAIGIGALHSPELSGAGLVLAAIAGAASMAVYGIVASPQWLTTTGHYILTFLPVNWQAATVAHLEGLRGGFASVRSRRSASRIFLNSLLQWMLLALCVYLSMLAFQLSISPTAAIVVLALIVVGISLPNAPAFIGTIEYCFVGGLAIFGVDPTLALSIAVFYHVLSFAFVTLSGIYFMRRYGTSWSTLRRSAQVIKSGDS